LLENSREIDVVGRYGGEELVVLLYEIGQEEAVEVAERMRNMIENLKVLPGQKDLQLTVSIGVATLVPESGIPIPVNAEYQKEILESLLTKAGHALRQAKQRGRNQIAISQESD
jgi:diguanylate cyclase (GGDEF)-like protein